MYRVINIGVNGSGRKRLDYAEKDAFDLYRAFTSELGPPGVNATCVTGRNATVERVLDLLFESAFVAPDYLTVTFSGHGNDNGIALHDGMLHFADLAEMLRGINAKAKVLIADSCGAGGFSKYATEDRFGIGGVLEQSWAEALANAVPGLRVYMASSANAKSREGGNVRNGHFTHAILNSMFCANGELWVPPFRFISDREIFARARRYMQYRWPGDAIPEAQGIDRGTFPVMLSQADAPMGTASIRRFDLLDYPAAEVAVSFRYRRHVPTYVRCSVVEPLFGIELANDCKRIAPGYESTIWTHEFKVNPSVFDTAPLMMLGYGLGHPIGIEWRVVVTDQRSRVLAGRTRATSWVRRAA